MIVVGAGRVGAALKERSEAVGHPVQLVSRDQGWDALDGPQGDPVLLAVRNDDLVDVVARIPSHRRSDLVFLQNGAIRDLLRDLSLARATRGLLYFMVARRGDPITPGTTNWFCGPHGLVVARWLGGMGLKADDVDWARFSYYELEKLLWLACHGPLCEAHDATVGQIATTHRADLDALAAELTRVGRAALGVEAPVAYLQQRLVDYSLTIPTYRASVKEWPWRNGWLRDRARQHGVDTPLHDAWLEKTGHGDAP